MSHKQRRLVNRTPAIGSFGAQLDRKQAVKASEQHFDTKIGGSVHKHLRFALGDSVLSLAIILKWKKRERPRDLM